MTGTGLIAAIVGVALCQILVLRLFRKPRLGEEDGSAYPHKAEIARLESEKGPYS